MSVPEETWLQAGLALLALLAAAAWLGPGTLRPSASGLAVAGLGALVLLAAWTCASLLWSVAPDRTWEAVNRTVAYALVVALALVAGSAEPRAISRVAGGWLVIATAIAVYALAGKVFPGVLDHARQIGRLRAPLEYWNALALVCVLAVPVAVRFATARRSRRQWRIASLVALMLLLSCAGLTYSRGAIVALVVAVLVMTVVSGPRLPGLLVVALGLLAAAPVLAYAWSDDVLGGSGAALDAQISAGWKLGVVVVLSGALLAMAGWWLLWAERRVRWRRAWSVRAWLLLAAVATGLAAGGIVVVATSERGLGGSISHVAEEFTSVRRDPVFEPGRLLTTSSGNRWAWWREAAGAWSDEPVLGWGAGSFPVVRRLYRVAPNEVQHPHSAPMQWLAELGLVGLVLGLLGVGLLLAASVSRVRRLRAPHERALGGALLAASCAWAVHACVDWDWDIPGVTVPVLVFLGVLCGREVVSRPLGAEEPDPVRPLALFGVGVLVLAFLVSSVLPGWSAARTDDAFSGLQRRSPAALEAAAADASVAARLDPLAVRPLFAAAAVAEARGRLLDARRFLLEAVERQPWSIEAWERLTAVALTLADRDGATRAAERTLALDPADPRVIRFVARAQGVLAPPEASATATGTPLPPAGP